MNSYPNRYFDSDEVFFLLTLYSSIYKFDDFLDLEELYYMNIDMQYLPKFLRLLLNLGIIEKVTFDVHLKKGKNVDEISKKGDYVMEDIFFKYIKGKGVDRVTCPDIEYDCYIPKYYKEIQVNNNIFYTFRINLNLDKECLVTYMSEYFASWEQDKIPMYDKFNIKNLGDILYRYKSSWVDKPHFLKKLNGWNRYSHTTNQELIDNNMNFLKQIREEGNAIHDLVNNDENKDFITYIEKEFYKWTEIKENYYFQSAYIYPSLQIKEFSVKLETLKLGTGELFQYTYQSNSNLDEYSLIFYFLIKNVIKLKNKSMYLDDKVGEIIMSDDGDGKVLNVVTNPYTETYIISRDIEYSIKFSVLSYYGDVLFLGEKDKGSIVMRRVLEKTGQWVDMSEIIDELGIDESSAYNEITGIVNNLKKPKAKRLKKIVGEHIEIEGKKIKISFGDKR